MLDGPGGISGRSPPSSHSSISAAGWKRPRDYRRIRFQREPAFPKLVRGDDFQLSLHPYCTDRMKIKHAIILGIGAVTPVGCGDSTGISPEELEGTWTATSIVFTSKDDPSQRVDIITLGASFTMTVDSDGSVSTTFRDGQGGTDSDSGRVLSDGNKLTLAGATFTAERSGAELTISDDTEEFDFDNDGSDEPATLVATLIRR